MKTIIAALALILLASVAMAQTLSDSQQLCLERKARIELQMRGLQDEYRTNQEKWKSLGGVVDDQGNWTVTPKLAPKDEGKKK